MRHLLILLVIPFVATGCKSVECGPGTIDRNGRCEASDETTDPAKCGPFTELVGDKCVPMFPPTECDPSTTEADVDPETGVTTCIGTGGGGCSAPFACANPSSATKQTICGQLYDFETNMPFQGPNPSGAKCPSTPTASGPCSLDITAYDAIAFGTNPQTAVPLTDGGVEIDDCGRFRVKDIDVPGGPFIGLGIDDAGMPMGPTGTTVTVGIATPKRPNTATKDLEGWILKQSTVGQWQASGAPMFGTTGYYIPIYRAHSLKTPSPGDPFQPQAGVTFTRNGSSVPNNDYYFQANQLTHQTIDPNQMVTGMNGTVIIDNATVADSLAYGGSGGLSDTMRCRWEPHAGASLPGIAFIQIFRPADQIGQTCPL